MLASNSSSKRYGRGNASVAVDSIFGRKSSNDPFLFDSDGEPSPVKSKPVPSSKKKAKVKSSSHANDAKVKTNSSGGRAQARGRRKEVDNSERQFFDAEVVAQKRITRTNSSSSSKDSHSNFPSMQITSTTVYQSDNVESDSGASDFENTVPTMSISSETVKVSSADTFSLVSPTKSHRNLRSSTRSTSSVDSRGSMRPGDSERPKDFLQSKKTNSQSWSVGSCDGDSVDDVTSGSGAVESDRLRQFLGLAERRSRTPSVSSCGSYTNCATVESDRMRQFLLSSNTNLINGSVPEGAQRSVGTHKGESDRLKNFLQSDDGEVSSSAKSKTVKGRNVGRPKQSKTQRADKKHNKKRTEIYTKLVESDRLKKFLETDDSFARNVVLSDSEGSSDSLQDKTLLANNQMQESKRLQQFLGTSTVDTASTSSRSSAGSPVTTSLKLTESSRLKAFLNCGSNGLDSRESSPEALKVRTSGKRSSKQAESVSKHSGLSQEMYDVSIKGECSEKPSPPKRKFLTDEFCFDSDGEYQPPSRFSTTGRTGNKNRSTAADIVKPVINFEKMEGQKVKSSCKPAKKLLGTPGKSPAKYRYNHRAWLVNQEEEGELETGTSASHPGKSDRLKHPLGLRKIVKYPEKLGEKISTQVKVRQGHKELYTVVRNVRQAHECQDHGENQQIDDDLEFLLDGLEPREKVSSRYLSAVSLAKKCTNATFRMHLRSHSSLSQIFSSLSDACSDPRLALSTTAIMFMLCQDRLNMDLDRTSLKLMVQLLEYDDRAHLDNQQDIADYCKSIDTVYDLYKSAIPAGEELLEKSDLSPGYLAMECLLVLTSRRSGDWFKEELREAGAVVSIGDSIIEKTVVVMSADYDMELSPNVLIHIKKICRGLRVLEHVTAYNTANQRLIIEHRDGEFVLSLARLLMFGVEAIPTHSIDQTSLPSSAGHLILQKLLGVLRVLVNITHDSERGCSTVNSFSGIIEVLLKCVLQSCQYVLEEQRFDLLVLGIGLSINMCEHSADCRETLLNCETLSSYDSICEQETVTAAEALLLLFTQRLRAAEKIEAETGELQESDVTRAVSDDLSESITEVLHKAGRHMEDTIVASYIALLVGVIVQHSPDYIDQIRQYLSSNSFQEIIEVLQKFLNFMKMADAASGNTGSKSIGTVIGYLKECT